MTEQWWPDVDEVVTPFSEQTFPADEPEDRYWENPLKDIHAYAEKMISEWRKYRRVYVNLARGMAKAGYHVPASVQDEIHRYDCENHTHVRFPRKMKKQLLPIKKGNAGPVRTPFEKRGRR